MSKESKHCPLCGSNNIKEDNWYSNDCIGFHDYVTCNNCEFSYFKTTWNEPRPLEDKLRAEIEDLKEERSALLKVNHELKLKLEKEY